MSAADHNYTVTQLTMDTLIVQLLEDLLKVAREVHGPKDGSRQKVKEGMHREG